MSGCCCECQSEEGCDSPKCLNIKPPPHTLLYDVVGPYPDEVIMAILDRILYLSGAAKITRMIMMAGYGQAFKTISGKSRAPASPSCCCTTPRPSSSCRTCCSNPPSSRCCLPKSPSSKSCLPKSPCIKTSRISAAGGCPRQRSTRVDFEHPAEDIAMRKDAGGFTLKDRMKLSMSLCSLACEQLKSKLVPNESPQRKENKWLWTRLVRSKDGCKIYEVYKDSDAKNSPTKLGSKAPVILFLVMPNGYIMPFESLSSN
ncbi:hypothetical protein KR009_003654 [Drosophila setifemur]|nr:hypothetical protein KR009_003654 [Drosophila setifemur]